MTTLLRQGRGPLLGGFICLLIVDAADISLPILIKLAIDGLSGIEADLSVTTAAALYCFLIFIQAIARFWYRTSLNKAAAACAHSLRTQIIQSVFKSQYRYDSHASVGKILSRANSDIDAISSAFEFGFITLMDALVYLVCIPPIVLYIAPKIALPALLPLLVVPLLVRLFEKKISRLYKNSQHLLDSLLGFSQEMISSLRIMKALGVESTLISRYQKLALDYKNANTKLARTDSLLSPSFDFTLSIGILIALLVGGFGVIDGTITLGTFVLLQRYTQQLLWPMQALGITVSTIQKARSSILRLNQLLEENQQEKTGTQPMSASGVRLEAKDITLILADKQTPLLNAINLKLFTNEVTALVGDNGSGKTTLLNVLAALLQPNSGEVQVNGSKVTEFDLQAFRRAVVTVPQDTFIASGSLRENLLLFVPPNVHISDQELSQLIYSAGLGEDLLELPQGLDTVIGERGITVSGGQKQRIGLARALLAPGSFLILDDVFSALDISTEQQVWQALRKRKIPVLFVTQRLSSVKYADRIVVLQNGTITEDGNFEELRSIKGSWFERFYNRQKLIEELEQYCARNTQQVQS